MQNKYEKLYDEYYDSQEKANKIPLNFDEWMKTHYQSESSLKKVALYDVDLHAVIDERTIVFRFDNTWNYAIKLERGMSKAKLIEMLNIAVTTLIKSEDNNGN